MIGAVARKLFGSSNDRRVRTYRARVDAINALEGELSQLSDEALRARTDEFKKQLAGGASLDDILIPAFPLCARRVSVRWGSATSTFSSSAAWFCTRAKSPR